MRVSAETVCDTKKLRFHFFVAGDITMGEDTLYNCGAFAINSGWAEFGL